MSEAMDIPEVITEDGDDTDVIVVDTTDTKFTTPVKVPRQRRNRASTGQCKTCGKELSDGRASYCEEHRPSKGVETLRNKAPKRRSGKKNGVSAEVNDGMTDVTANILFILTLTYAYTALRGRGIPDPSGAVSEQMALTDDEAAAIGRPLARLFLSTEQGRKVAPSIVDNRDLIDAAFAAWDWFRRMNDVLDQYGTRQSVQTPRSNDDGDTRPPQGDTTGNGLGSLGGSYAEYSIV
jgi:hypothetical protein